MKTAKAIVLVFFLCVFCMLYLQMKPLSQHDKDCSKGMLRLGVIDSLYQGSNSEFISAGYCDDCHGFDPAGIANVDAEGADVNLVDDWSSSIMANSAKDPFWRAKVSQEVIINPQLQTEIEGTCTKCHAPLGRFAGLMNGQEDYSIEEMLQDSTALDGVSCLACHRQAPQPEVALHTGQLIFDEATMAFGQYVGPLVTPMALATGYIPEFGGHISDSKLCASCHSLVTPTVDLEGNLTGNEFVEQATWHEWLNSSYPANDISCQSCHLPVIEGQNIGLANGFDTPPRPDFAKHTLAGGNTAMLALMRDNREDLGIYAGESQFNETIAATLDNLQNKSLQLDLTEISRTEDTLFLEVKLTNTTGHKLPSGYPSRRMSLHLFVQDDLGNELFRSGGFDEDYYLTGESLPYEPHYQTIRDESEVQLYEMVMGDVLNDRTTILTRANSHLKDNRLVPIGFSTSSNVYDTTEIVLNIPDPDFNFDPTEGSGTDIIYYNVPLNGFQGVVNVTADVYYQSMPPIFMDGLFSTESEEINQFEGMFGASDPQPILMKSKSIEVDEHVGVSSIQSKEIRIWQDLGGRYQVYTNKVAEMKIFAINGQLVYSERLHSGITAIRNNFNTGTYILTIEDGFITHVERILIP